MSDMRNETAPRGPEDRSGVRPSLDVALHLRRIYAEVLEQPMPAELAALIQRLEARLP